MLDQIHFVVFVVLFFALTLGLAKILPTRTTSSIQDLEAAAKSEGQVLESTEEVVSDDGKSYVELKVTPKDGYSVEEIIVTDINGERIEVTDNKFFMPGSDVKIEVKYVQGEYLPIPDTFLSKSLTLIIIGLILVGLGIYTINYVRQE